MERLADGRVSQILTLKASPNSRLARPEAWLRETPLRRFNQPGEQKKTRWRKGEWASIEPWTLVIQADEYIKLDVFTKAEIEGRSHFAQTTHLLYGHSDKKGTDRGDLSDVPNLAEFQISSNREFYWPQTGHEFTFTLKGLDTTSSGLEVWSSQGELLDRPELLAGVFKYTPTHDPTLDRAGYKAWKPLIFVARNHEDNTTSFTLMVHRSRLAGLNKGAGLAIFTTALVLCSLVVGLARLKKVLPC